MSLIDEKCHYHTSSSLRNKSICYAFTLKQLNPILVKFVTEIDKSSEKKQLKDSEVNFPKNFMVPTR